MTLLDALSMPIGYALASGRFRIIIDKNSRIPLVKSFRLPPPSAPGAQFIELDIFQGDSDNIVDNEYLGTLKVPAAASGRKIDFKLNEECLLQVVVDEPTGPRQIDLATRDTPETLKKALAEEAARRAAEQPVPSGGEQGGGLFSRFKKMWGR